MKNLKLNMIKMIFLKSLKIRVSFYMSRTPTARQWKIWLFILRFWGIFVSTLWWWGFPFGYVVQPKIASVQWAHTLTPCSCLFDETDCYCSRSADIIHWRDADSGKVSPLWQLSIANAMFSIMMRPSSFIWHPLPFISQKDKHCRVSMRCIFAWTVILKMPYIYLRGKVIKKMYYEGESPKRNLEKCCAKFHQQLRGFIGGQSLVWQSCCRERIRSVIKSCPSWMDCKYTRLQLPVRTSSSDGKKE